MPTRTIEITLKDDWWRLADGDLLCMAGSERAKVFGLVAPGPATVEITTPNPPNITTGYTETIRRAYLNDEIGEAMVAQALGIRTDEAKEICHGWAEEPHEKTQPCGHDASQIHQDAEGTAHCEACEGPNPPNETVDTTHMRAKWPRVTTVTDSTFNDVSIDVDMLCGEIDRLRAENEEWRRKRSWKLLMEWIDEFYPLEVFGPDGPFGADEPENTGPRLIRLMREIDRLRSCMSRAGLERFMRDGSPEDVAEHMRKVAAEANAEINRLRRDAEQMRDTIGRLGESLAETEAVLMATEGRAMQFRDQIAALKSDLDKAISERPSIITLQAKDDQIAALVDGLKDWLDWEDKAGGPDKRSVCEPVDRTHALLTDLAGEATRWREEVENRVYKRGVSDTYAHLDEEATPDED